MVLREKALEFLNITGMPKAKFAQAAGIHPTTMNLWLNKDGYEITPDNIKRIDVCLEMQKSKLREYLGSVN